MVSAVSTQAQNSALRVCYMAEIVRERPDAASNRDSPKGRSAHLYTGDCHCTGMHSSLQRHTSLSSTLLAQPCRTPFNEKPGRKKVEPAEHAWLELQGIRKLLTSAHRFGPSHRLQALACDLSMKIMEDCCTI